MKKPSATNGSVQPTSQKIVPVALLMIIVVGLAILFWPRKPQQASQPGPANTNPPAPAPTSVTAESKPDFKAVLGNWFREDGGYRLELTSAESNGQLQAAYFNPRPINVSLATVTNDGGTLKIRVELNDVGYPGCVYSLAHDRMNDRLIGTYFQAAMGETYEIMFVRAE